MKNRNLEKETRFTQEDIELYNKVKEIIKANMEPILFNFLEHKIGFSILLLEVYEKNREDVSSFLKNHIRNSDFLIKIFEDKNFYILFAQNTQSGDATIFSNRLINELNRIETEDYQINNKK